MLRITSAQINPTIGDIEGNVALMVSAAQSADNAGSRLVVFPELSLTAYYPADMLDDSMFAQRIANGLAMIQAESRKLPRLYWALGAPTARDGVGKRFFNSLLVYLDGEVVLDYAKVCLPTYNVFDEKRHFEPGPDVASILRIGDTEIGFMICEDGWNDAGLDYVANPFQRLADAKPDLVVSINASPSDMGKREQRHRVFTSACKRHGLPLLYVNQVGGHDQLVYDGASFAVQPGEGVVYEAARFTEDICHLQFDPETGSFLDASGTRPAIPTPAGLPLMEFYRRQVVLGLRDYARRCGFKQAVVGSSGGIDSALTLALAVEALGRENVVAITMPSEYSSAGSVGDSAVLCETLGIPLLTHPIRALVEQYRVSFEQATSTPLKGLPLENVQARIRGTVLMEYSNTFGCLLLTTGNKSEIAVGYCTLYGDTNGGLGLIGDLYKTEIFALCRHINDSAGYEVIPAAIIDKAPSAELAPGQQDTDSLPPYEVLDAVLKDLIEGDQLSAPERAAVSFTMGTLSATPEGQALIARVKDLIARNEYKRRQAPPLLRVRGKAFGAGRQMPIAANYGSGSLAKC